MSETQTTPAGWYPHPGAEGWIAYWDGQAWTEHVQPAEGAAAPEASGQNAAVSDGHATASGAQTGAVASSASTSPFANLGRGLLLCLAGAAIAVIGCFLPAADVAGVSIDGNTLLGSSSGLIVIILAVGVAVLALASARQEKPSPLLLLVGALLLGYVVYLANGGLDFTDEGLADPSPGIGVWVVGLGGVAALLGGLLAMRDADS